MVRVTGFIQKNADLLTFCSIDIATSMSNIDILAKAITSILILFLALRRFLKRNDDKKDIEQIRKEIHEELEKEAKDTLKS